MVAANVSVQRSTDRGDTLTGNPAGKRRSRSTTASGWSSSAPTPYLGYREFTAGGDVETAPQSIRRWRPDVWTGGRGGVGGNTTGNIDVDQREDLVYFCHQRCGSRVLVAVRPADQPRGDAGRI
jgi:hypothetical protein